MTRLHCELESSLVAFIVGSLGFASSRDLVRM